VVNKPASGKVVARAIASLQKKQAVRQQQWNRLCNAELKARVEREELAAFAERYLKLRDELLRETAEWHRDHQRRYLFAVLREMRAQRRRHSR